MRRLLFATAALLLPMAAQATPITVTVTADGGPATTFTGTDTVSVTAQSFGVFNLNNFSVFAAPVALNLPSLLNSNTLDTDTTSADGNPHTLAVDVVGFFTGATPGLRSVESSFDTAGLTAGWTVSEITDIDGVNLPPGLSFTATATQHAAALDQFDTVNIGSSFTASEHFLITTNGGLGQANNGIEMTAAVGAPGPEVASGVPGLLAMALGGLLFWRRRQQVA